MSTYDIQDVVDIHLQAFDGFFLASLGPRFLKQFYSAVIEDPTGITLVAVKDEEIYGFVAGTIKPSEFYRRLIIKRALSLFLASIVPILVNPRIIPRLVRGFSLPTQSARPEGWGTLQSLAVSPNAQHKGIGHLLVSEFLKVASARSLTKINLLTDKNNNDPVNHFYQRFGFYLGQSYVTPEGRWINEYVYDLDKLLLEPDPIHRSDSLKTKESN